MAMRFGIFVATSQAIGPLGSGLWRVRILRRHRAAASAPTPPARSEIRSVKGSDEQSLETSGALHPQTLEIGMSVRQSGHRGLSEHAERRSHDDGGDTQAMSDHG